MELFWDPRNEAMNKVTPVENEPEMSEFESAFLCGLIKKNRPKKILEVGIAAGGTTAIILQCIEMLGMNEECEIISVDLNEKFYRKDGHDTGFLGDELKSKLEKSLKHKFLLGKVLAERIEDIGEHIDLVILDTVHFLPGEVLDFPVILPFLSPDAIVVLHDVAYHQYNTKEGMATQILLNAATGIRMLPMGEDKMTPTRLPNIGAICVNDDTKKYIDAIFHAMVLPWYYLPKQSEIKIYHDFYNKYYEKTMVDIFDTAVELNTKLIKEGQKVKLSLKERIMRAGGLVLKGY